MMKGLVIIAAMLTMISVDSYADTPVKGDASANDQQKQTSIETTGSTDTGSSGFGLTLPVPNMEPTPVGDHHGHHNGFESTYR
jgi:hypothetical protein